MAPSAVTRAAASRREIPYWLLAAIFLGLLFAWLIAADGNYTTIFRALRHGVVVTLWVSVVAFALAIALGLVVALGRLSRFRVLREVATFYVEIVRGIPVLVLLFYVAFVGAPQFVIAWNWLFSAPIEAGLLPEMSVRDFDMTWRAIVALTISYPPSSPRSSGPASRPCRAVRSRRRRLSA